MAKPYIQRAMDAWAIWILLAIVLAVGEILTLGFFLAPFAAGAVLGAVADLAGADAAVSIIAFLLSSVLLFGFVRPIARRHLVTPAQLRTGAAALVGQTAIVTERIANDEGRGSVKLGGELWTARAYDEDAIIEAGSRVHVIEIRGATALVSGND